jgi:uncharacterized membrane protein (UPF0127 family)
LLPFIRPDEPFGEAGAHLATTRAALEVLRLDAIHAPREGARSIKEPYMRLYSLALLASCLVSGCAGASQPWVEVGGQRYAIELADDDAERARGLMFRDAMANDHGMLFIHDAQEPQAYWMKNTKIALDILYFDDGRKLVAQQRDVPPCSLGDACPSYPSDAPARYVLELNAGEAARLGLKEGAKMNFSPDIPPAK